MLLSCIIVLFNILRLIEHFKLFFSPVRLTRGYSRWFHVSVQVNCWYFYDKNKN